LKSFQKIEGELLKLVKRAKRQPLIGEVSLEIFLPENQLSFDFSDNRGGLFFAASVTKMVTSATFLSLQEKGALSLNEPISNYLTKKELAGLLMKGKEDYSHELTVGKLLANRSGIPDYYQGKRLDPQSDIESVTREDPGWSFSEAIETAKSLPSASGKVKGRAHYSFTNYQILSEILERSTKRGLQEVFRDEIFEPAGMPKSFLFDHDSENRSPEIASLKHGKNRYLGFKRMASLRGEGALVSNTNELIRLLSHLNQVRCPGSLAHTMRKELTPLFPFVRYGLGIMEMKVPGLLIGSVKTPHLLGHLGATGAFAFVEENSGAQITGTVNQIGNPALGSRLMLQIASKISQFI
jgi:D-alanyl-D-alanine carboxypeptidase